jgi:hypothetical protein
MGCDIHGVWQKRVGDAWDDVPSEYDQCRDYRLFAVLAGVRAGAKAPAPIAAPRGLPDGVSVEADRCDFGDHSRSWLTSAEMLAARGRFSRVFMTGIVDRATYEAWDGESCPDEYSAGVVGSGVLMFDGMNDSPVVGRLLGVPQWTHRSVNWFENHSEQLAYFFDEVRRLHDLHGEVRFVFGFDS